MLWDLLLNYVSYVWIHAMYGCGFFLFLLFHVYES